MTRPPIATQPEVTIRHLKSIEDCRHFQEVQRRVWGGETETDIVPTHVLVTQAKNGGLLLGAFAPDGPEPTGGMVGLAFGWPAFTQGDSKPKLKFCSHMVGVLPHWQGKGVGLRLKLAQRDILLANGQIDWMTWTYDPLQRVNAVFNIHRLGATCATYMRNVYGEMADNLNAGTPSDRFQVDWHLSSKRVNYALAPQRRHADWEQTTIEILPTRPVTIGSRLRAPVESKLRHDGHPLAVPLPDSVASLRVESGLLMAWRFFLRHAIEQSLAVGYQIVDCVELQDRGWHYILTPPEFRPFADQPWP